MRHITDKSAENKCNAWFNVNYYPILKYKCNIKLKSEYDTWMMNEYNISIINKWNI